MTQQVHESLRARRVLRGSMASWFNNVAQLYLTHSATRHKLHPVIRTFKCGETQGIFELRRSRRLPGGIQQVALRKLRMLNRSQSIDDLKIPPASRLEKLSGDRAGYWSIRINDQWRICFRWEDGNAFEVETVDYH